MEFWSLGFFIFEIENLSLRFSVWYLEFGFRGLEFLSFGFSFWGFRHVIWILEYGVFEILEFVSSSLGFCLGIAVWCLGFRIL